jgi:isopenicillin-N N-acyltransferase-like protein
MTEPPLPMLHLIGSPWEIGVAHGQAAAGPIARNLGIYFRRFAEEAELPREEVIRRTAQSWPRVSVRSPEFAAMVEGIAWGAGLPLLDVAALNLRFEFMYGEFSRMGRRDLAGAPSPAGACTSFAVLPGASADGRLRVGQNWDWIPGVAGLLLHVTRPDGLRVLCFTEAGVAGGKIGQNSAGVGLAINGLLSSEDDWSRIDRPFHARTWDVLCSRTLDEAADVAAGGDRACSANFLIAQAGSAGQGAAVSVETAPGGVCHLYPAAGVLVHANHFRDPKRLGVWQPLVEERRSTYHRCHRMERLLADAVSSGGLDTGRLEAILRDHDGHPESICRHPNPALPEADRHETVVSVIMDLHEGRMRVAPGPPCRAAYHEHAL